MPHVGLFGRLFVLFSITTVLLAACIAFGSFTQSEAKAKAFILERQERLQEMVRQVAQKPVDIDALRQNAHSNRVSIMIKKGDQRWSTLDDFPSIEQLLESAEPIGKLYFSKQGFKYYLLAQENDTWVAVTSIFASIIIYPGWLVYWPWLLALLILGGSYLILRKMLKPVSDAVYSAKMLSEGNFDYRIQSHPKTELAELTLGLNKMSADLKQLFESKDELLMAISHELRTPMARMKISLAMLERNSITDDLAGDIALMDTLVEQLLEGERLRKGNNVLNLSTYFLPALVDDVLQEQGVKGQVTVVADIPEVAVNLDLGRIKFVLRNLLHNAVKHSGTNKNIELSVVQANSTIDIAVSDHGRGIPDEQLDKIFEPFYQVQNIKNRATGGTGLGLYLCQRIVQAHGGNLSAENLQPNGCRFRFNLTNSVPQ